MLRLVGRPNVSTLPLTLFERSYPVSMTVPWVVAWRSYACCDTCI